MEYFKETLLQRDEVSRRERFVQPMSKSALYIPL